MYYYMFSPLIIFFFSQFYGNNQILGKTKPVDNATSCVLNELFTIKPKGAPRSIQ